MLLPLLASGCGRTGYDLVPTPELAIAVVPVYPLHADWNDYVRNSAPGLGRYSQADIGCDGSETGRGACIHGGEARMAVLTGIDSCQGLSAEDQLGVFTWSCRVVDGNARFYSRDFAPGKGLGDLITASGWKSNALIVSGGEVDFVNEPSVWDWSNPILELPANDSSPVEVLDAEGTIYVASSSAATNGYNIDADRISLVVLPGQTLRFGDSTAGNTDENSGEVATSDSWIVATGQQKFVWIEGSFDADGDVSADGCILLFRVFGARLHQLSTRSGTKYGIRLASSSGNHFTRVSVRSAVQAGIHLHTVSDNRFQDLAVTQNGGHGIFGGFSISNSSFVNIRASNNGMTSGGHGVFLNSSTGNVLYNINASNNEFSVGNTLLGSGLQIQGDESSDNIVSLVVGFNNHDRGLMVTGSNARNTIAHVTAANAFETAGLQIDYGDGNTLNDVVSVHNSGTGLALFASANQTLANDIVAAHNGANGVQLTQANNDVFTGRLMVGPHPGFRCRLDEPGTMPGLIHETCTDTGADGSSSYTDQSSTAVLSSVDLSGSFVGRVVSDDAANPDDDAGAQSFESIDNWTDFDNPFRGWGIRGSSFTDDDTALGMCTAGQLCGIWDWRLRASDTALRNAHGAFEAGAPCPPSVDGDEVITDQLSTPNTFLPAAIEVMLDEVGDDDGLCESGEACIYAPNLGAYQGEGDYTLATCEFQDGIVSGVTMYGYPVNGP